MRIFYKIVSTFENNKNATILSAQIHANCNLKHEFFHLNTLTRLLSTHYCFELAHALTF